MQDRQIAFAERLLLSSAIPPALRRDAKRVLYHPEVSTLQTSEVIDALQAKLRDAPRREERPAEHRVASLRSKVLYYSARGAKPQIKPTAADLAWIAEQRKAAAR